MLRAQIPKLTIAYLVLVTMILVLSLVGKTISLVEGGPALDAKHGLLGFLTTRQVLVQGVILEIALLAVLITRRTLKEKFMYVVSVIGCFGAYHLTVLIYGIEASCGCFGLENSSTFLPWTALNQISTWLVGFLLVTGYPLFWLHYRITTANER